MVRLLSIPRLAYWYITNPARFNAVLNKAERRRGRVKLRSYPTHVGINISNLCNQHCIFCALDNSKAEMTNWLGSDLFKRMRWLRFVSEIDLFCGAGEALANPHFPEIAYTVRQIASKSHISMFTNALALHGRNMEAVLDNLDMLHVSLNAVNQHVYEQIIRGDYGQVMRNLDELSKRRPQEMFVELSLVLMKQTVSEVKPMIDYAADHRFQRVIVGHYVATPNMNGLGIQDSVKNDAETMRYVRNLENYARSRGVEFFLCETSQISGECYAPYTTLYFTNDETGKRVFGICCSGGRMNSYFEKSVYVNMRAFWNSDRMQEMRRTVNRPLPEQNNLCFLCRIADKTDPEWRIILPTLKTVQDRGITFTSWNEPNAFPPHLYT